MKRITYEVHDLRAGKAVTNTTSYGTLEEAVDAIVRLAQGGDRERLEIWEVERTLYFGWKLAGAP